MKERIVAKHLTQLVALAIAHCRSPVAAQNRAENSGSTSMEAVAITRLTPTRGRILRQEKRTWWSCSATPGAGAGAARRLRLQDLIATEGALRPADHRRRQASSTSTSVWAFQRRGRERRLDRARLRPQTFDGKTILSRATRARRSRSRTCLTPTTSPSARRSAEEIARDPQDARV
jgi:hypothetical protein